MIQVEHYCVTYSSIHVCIHVLLRVLVYIQKQKRAHGDGSQNERNEDKPSKPRNEGNENRQMVYAP